MLLYVQNQLQRDWTDALDAYVGLTREPNNEQALKRISKLLETPWPMDHDDAYFSRSEVLELQRIIKEEEKTKATSSSSRQMFAEAAKFVTAVNNGETLTFGEAIGIAARTDPTQARITADRAWAMMKWRQFSFCVMGWFFINRAFEVAHVGGPAAVVLSTEDFGPLYNALDKNGCPIPGTLADEEYDRAGRTFFGTPKNGAGRFLGLQTFGEGEIDFRFAPPMPYPGPLITQEDLDVALVLTFSKERPQWPSLSLGSPDRWGEFPRALHWKEWKPSWLGATNFGRTFYATDYWLSRLSWHIADWQSGEIEHPLQRLGPTAKEQFASLRSEIIKGESRSRERHMLRPNGVEWSWSQPASGHHRCVLHNVSMRFDGSEIATLADDSISRSQLLNDDRSRVGRVANLLSSRFSEISNLWPIYERQRQLTALVYGLTELQKRGFCPGPSLQHYISAKSSNLESSPGARAPRQYVLVPAPS